MNVVSTHKISHMCCVFRFEVGETQLASATCSCLENMRHKQCVLLKISPYEIVVEKTHLGIDQHHNWVC